MTRNSPCSTVRSIPDRARTPFGKTLPSPWTRTASVDDEEPTRELATAPDGTQVPVSHTKPVLQVAPTVSLAEPLL